MTSKIFKLFLLVLILSATSCKKEIHTIAFYNLENLFDTLDNPHTNDNEFLPDSEKNWDLVKYQSKLDSLAKVISLIGDGDGPEVIGMCEMENRMVLEDLAKRPAISSAEYQIAHLESNDYRGIDVALFYKNDFRLDTIIALEVSIEDEPRFRTRDVLYVRLNDARNRVWHFYLNHWPSRIGGTEETDYKRMAASNVLKNHLESLLKNDPNAQVLIMGDFNDEPVDESLLNLSNSVTNLFKGLDSLNRGTYCYRDDWNMLDQILVSNSLLDGRSPDYIPNSAEIFEKEWLKQKGEDNRYKGYPLRTWGGRLYLGGFSDHFPVFIQIK